MVNAKTLPDAFEEGRDAQPLNGASYVYSVIEKKLVNGNYTNYSRPLASCKAGSSTSTCTINQSVTASATISTDFGVSTSFVSGKIGISRSYSVSSSVSCTSKTLRPGQYFNAYARGDRYSYRIKRVYQERGRVYSTTYSKTLYAFKPRANSITCS